jgi:anti-sigma B factor antagonist
VTTDDRFAVAAQTTTTGSTLTIRGDLDASTAPEVLKEIEGITVSGGELLVVDLAGLTFCDSSGITALIAAHNVAEAANADMVLVSAPAQLTRTLGLIGLAGFFTTYATADQAIAART